MGAIWSPSIIVSNTPSWKELKFGGGGWCIGLDIAQDGTRVHRTDTCGGYVFNKSLPSPGNAGGSGSWQQVVNSISMPNGSFTFPPDSWQVLSGYNHGAGLLDFVVAPSNSQILYMFFADYVFVSTNQGASWVRTTCPQDTAHPDANDTNVKTMAHRIAVDPANPNIVLVGNSLGLYYSTNGTAGASSTFTKITGVNTPAAVSGSPGQFLIAFDPSTTSGGSTPGIYASCSGTGVYHTTSGPSSGWTLTTGTQTTHEKLICDIAGNAWLITSGGAGVYRYLKSTTTWSSMGQSGVFGIASDPANASNVYLISPGSGGQLVYTRTGTSTTPTWFTSAVPSISALDVPWQSNIYNGYLSTGDIKFDPSVSNFLCYSWGFGFLTTTPPTSATNGAAFTWTTAIAGQEQTVTNWGVSPPGGYPLVGVWDLQCFVCQDLTKYPTTQGTNNLSQYSNFNAGWGVDWASANPSTLVVLSNFGGDLELSGYSSDKGVTWQQFATFPPGGSAGGTGGNIGGSIAAASSTCFMMVRTDNGANANQPYFTFDSGTTWHPITMSPVPTSGSTGWNSNWTQWNIVNLCADRVAANTFYMWNQNAPASGGGVWKIVITGSTTYTATNMNSGTTISLGYDFALRSVPKLSTIDTTGHLFFSTGRDGDPPAGTNSVTFSKDGGSTWTQVANLKCTMGLGFGAPISAGAYPAIYAAGFISGVYSIWQCTNFNTTTASGTWTNLGAFPGNSIDKVRWIEGDSNTFGKFYVGFAGSGAMYYG